MFEPLITRFLNHLANQNEWAREALKPYSGKAVLFVIPPARMKLIVLEDGGLAAAGEAAEVLAKVTLPPSVALRLLAGDANAETLVSIDGNTELALALSKVLRNLSWEYEEDLSKVIGDVPAHQLSQFGRRAAAEIRAQTLNVVDIFAEYWQEERPLIAKKRHVERFVSNVSDLRDEVERLEKRLDKLTGNSSAPTAPTNPQKDQ